MLLVQEIKGSFGRFSYSTPRYVEFDRAAMNATTKIKAGRSFLFVCSLTKELLKSAGMRSLSSSNYLYAFAISMH